MSTSVGQDLQVLIIFTDTVCRTDEEIYKAVEFQEKYFKMRIIR